jgi:hypothetical protein
MNNKTSTRPNRGPILWIALAAILALGGIAAYLNKDQWNKIVTKAEKKADEPRVFDEATAAKATGPFNIKFTRRSAISDQKSVTARCKIPPESAGNDYTFADRGFNVFKPKTPAGDGKFGLMIGLCFKEYGPPPAAWLDVLEKHHLIWVCPYNNGDDQPEASRIGLLLDAVDNAQRLWPVDPNRVYLSAGSPNGIVAGTACYYPEIFHGVIESPFGSWFGPGQKRPFPAARQWHQAQTSLRVFIATRQSDDPKQQLNSRSLEQAYEQTGFAQVKMLEVPEADMGHYINYTAGWFGQAVEFVEGD